MGQMGSPETDEMQRRNCDSDSSLRKSVVNMKGSAIVKFRSYGRHWQPGKSENQAVHPEELASETAQALQQRPT
jgi:hypothetical protein